MPFNGSVELVNAEGKVVGNTGGSWAESFIDATRIINAKVNGMRRRGYFTDAVQANVVVKEQWLGNREKTYTIKFKR